VDSGSAPECVRHAHLPDQVADLTSGVRPSATSSTAFPCPIKAEAFPVPGNNGVWLNDHETCAPVRPQAGEPDPQDPIGCSKVRAFLGRAFKDVELVTKGEDLSLQGSAGPKATAQGREQRSQSLEHRIGAYQHDPASSISAAWSELLVATSAISCRKRRAKSLLLPWFQPAR
jgi:hypothetical protein